MTSSHPTPAPCQWFSWLAAALDRRSAPRLARLFFGAVLAMLVACVVQLAGNALIVVYALRQLREPVGLPAPSSLQPVPDGMASAV